MAGLLNTKPPRPAHPLRSAGGAFLSIVACVAVGLALAGAAGHQGAWLIPPLGASAVLVFAVTASPLAQPRAVIAGNTASALCGLGVALCVAWPPLAAPCAVALAILAMQRLGCLHPPGGAVALVVAMGTGTHWAEGLWLVALSVAGSAVMVATGLAFHRSFGSSYPHHAQTMPTPLDAADVQAVLDLLDDRPDIAIDDLAALVEAVNARRRKRSTATPGPARPPW